MITFGAWKHWALLPRLRNDDLALVLEALMPWCETCSTWYPVSHWTDDRTVTQRDINRVNLRSVDATDLLEALRAEPAEEDKACTRG